MRISHRKYKPGDQVVRKRFLWLPLRLGEETRWLERARIVQEYVEVTQAGITGTVCARYTWRDKCFHTEGFRLSQ